VSRGRLLDSMQPWTEEHLEILRKHYYRSGSAGCVRYLPSRSAGEITARANRLGLRYRKNRKPSRVVQAQMEITGGPAPYRPGWYGPALQPQPNLPLRPGATDFAALPSLS